MLNIFFHDKHCLKIKLRWRNKRLSKKITEKRQNDDCMMSYVKNRTWYKKKIFSKCSSDHAEQLLPWSTLLKNQVKLRKQEIRSKNYFKRTKWRLYDVIRQSRDMIWKREFFQNVSLIILNNFYHDQHCFKIKL